MRMLITAALLLPASAASADDFECPPGGCGPLDPLPTEFKTCEQFDIACVGDNWFVFEQRTARVCPTRTLARKPRPKSLII